MLVYRKGEQCSGGERRGGEDVPLLTALLASGRIRGPSICEVLPLGSPRLFEEAVVSSRSDVDAKVSPSRSPARNRRCQPEQPSGLRGNGEERQPPSTSRAVSTCCYCPSPEQTRSRKQRLLPRPVSSVVLFVYTAGFRLVLEMLYFLRL